LSRTKDSQRYSKRCASTFYLYAISLRSVNSTACGSMANNLLFSFGYSTFEGSLYMQRVGLKTAAAASYIFII